MWNVLYVHVCLYIYIYMIMYHIRQNVVSAHRHKMCSFVIKHVHFQPYHKP